MPVIAAEASKSGVDVRLEIPATLPAANADSGMLQQAFLNLALNACQAMPTGGIVRIVTEREGQETVKVIIADHGVGIPPEDLDRIFTLYYTTKPDGSGIGLSLTYRIVQLHDGSIDVSSEVGRGTTMSVRLPAGSP